MLAVLILKPVPIQRKSRKMVPKADQTLCRKGSSAEVNKDREEHGKKPFDDDDNEPPEEKGSHFYRSSGLFHKGEHKKCLPMEKPIPYVITIASSSMLSSQQEISTTALLSILCMTSYASSITQTTKSSSQTVYKTPWICRRIFTSGRVLSTALPDQKEREKTVIHGMSMSMTAIMMTSSVPKQKALRATTNRDG